MRYFGEAVPKKVYPHSYEEAKARGQTAQHRASYRLNVECACSILAASSFNRVKGRVSLKMVRDVLEDYGPERVQWVLANTIQQRGSDTRYSEENREWAKGFAIPEDKWKGGDYRLGFIVEGWPPHINEFTNVVRVEAAAMQALEQEGKGDVPVRAGQEAGGRSGREHPLGDRRPVGKAQTQKPSIRRELSAWKPPGKGADAAKVAEEVR